MKKMKIYNPVIMLLLTTISMVFFGGEPCAYAQKTTDAALQQAGSSVSRGFPFADGRAGMSEKETIACGPASRNPTYFARSVSNKIDLSFGTIPPAGDRLGDTERIIGSWAVRAIYPAEAGRPETVSNIFFNGGFTSGSVTEAKGGARVFDLYGTTGFTGSMCLMKSGGDTQRRYVRISGVCGGAGEEVRFEVSTRPAVNQNGIVYFNEGDIFASGRFRGNITCGTTTDRTRVRTNLTND